MTFLVFYYIIWGSALTNHIYLLVFLVFLTNKNTLVSRVLAITRYNCYVLKIKSVLSMAPVGLDYGSNYVTFFSDSYENNEQSVQSRHF